MIGLGAGRYLDLVAMVPSLVGNLLVGLVLLSGRDALGKVHR